MVVPENRRFRENRALAAARKSERNIGWARRAMYEAVRPHGSGGVYVNDLDRHEGQQRVCSAYGAHFERLVAPKQTHDPTNFFRINQSTAPPA